MKLNIPDEHIPLVIHALEHYYAYTRAVQRDDSRYQRVADLFKRCPPDSPRPVPTARKRRKARG